MSEQDIINNSVSNTKGMKRIPSITDEDFYVSNNENNRSSSSLKLSTTSWASQIEEEIGDSMSNELLSKSTDNFVSNDTPVVTKKTYDINNIISNYDIETINDITLLYHQTYIMNNIRKELKNYMDKLFENNEKYDFSDCINKLQWLLHVSKYFSDKLNLNSIVHTIKGKGITRSSYKFCDYGYNCEYNYNKKYQGCFAQHYVHNYVYADIHSLIEYINIMIGKEEYDAIRYSEIIKCMNTISYVINHMYEELKYINHYNKTNNMHIERTPEGNINKNIRNKPKYKNKRNNIATNV